MRIPRRRLLTLLPLVMLAVGCRERKEAEGSGPFARQVGESVAQIEKATGMPFKRRPVLQVTSKDKVREFLLARFNEESPAAELAAEEQVFKTLGLIPEDLDYRKFLLDLLNEQIVGYYDPRTDVLYVVDGLPKETTGVAITHELIHAWQDQHVDLDSIQNITGDVDRSLAVHSVLEGQATYEQMTAMLGGEVALRVPGGWDQVRQTIREAQGDMPMFASAPLMIQESLIFPYLSGADFVRRFKGQRPKDNPLMDLPVSTEQVLHTSAFFNEKRDVPSAVTLPAPTGGEKVYENGIGEFGTRIFLFEHAQDQSIALQGAMGWDGDRYVLVRTPGGHAIAWVSIWDTDLDAAEYADAMAETVLQRYGGVPAADSSARGAGVRRYTGRGRSVEVRTRQVGGRTAVMYVDAPAGQPTTFIDLDAVRFDVK